MSSNIQNNYHKFRSQIPADVSLLLVTKYSSVSDIQSVVDVGGTDFAENKVQDALDKIPQISASHKINWHLIGHLQSNKARKAVEIFDVIQSVDSVALLERLNRISGELNKKIDVYFQVNIADDTQKNGFSVAVFESVMKQVSEADYSHLVFKGIMIIIPICDAEEARGYFKDAKALFDKAKQWSQNIEVLSMGMSQDYKIAVECASNMVRIGSAIFK